MKISSFTCLVSLIISDLCLRQINAKNSFGAHQNVEGMDNGQPNVVMQSVVLGKNKKKHGYDSEDDDYECDENMEATMKRFMKLICPCMMANTDDGFADDDYDDEFNDNNYGNGRIERMVRMFNNYRKGRSGSFRSLQSPRYRNYQRRTRNFDNNERDLSGYRSRASRMENERLSNLMNSDGSDEDNEGMRSFPLRSTYYRSRDYNVDSSELDEPVRNRGSNDYGFRQRRKQNISSLNRRRFGDGRRPIRFTEPVDEPRSSSHQQPRDILYIPQTSKPVRRRRRPYIPQWDAE